MSISSPEHKYIQVYIWTQDGYDTMRYTIFPRLSVSTSNERQANGHDTANCSCKGQISVNDKSGRGSRP